MTSIKIYFAYFVAEQPVTLYMITFLCFCGLFVYCIPGIVMYETHKIIYLEFYVNGRCAGSSYSKLEVRVATMLILLM